MARVRERVVVRGDGRIVEGPKEILGLTSEKVLECAKALDQLARRTPLKPAMLGILYMRGWATARGEVTSAGEKFRARWSGARWTTRQPEGAITCRNCGEVASLRALPDDGLVPDRWLHEGGVPMCTRPRCAEAFARERSAQAKDLVRSDEESL